MSVRRNYGEGSLRQRPDGYWEATCSLGYDRKGKRVRPTFRSRSKREALEMMRAAQARHKAGLRVTEDRITVGEYLDEWYATWVEPRLRPSSADRYARVIRLHLKPALGDFRLSDLRAEDVQAFINSSAGGRPAERRSPSVVAASLAVLSAALKRARKSGLLEHNVASAEFVDPPTVKRSERPVLTMEQAREFVKAVAHHRFAPAYTLLVVLGLRRGEVLALKWGDIDFLNRKIQVRRGVVRVNGRGVLEGPPKTSSSHRVLVLPQPLVPVLTEQRRRYIEARHWATAQGRVSAWKDLDFVFCTRSGTPINPDKLSRHFKEVAERTGLPPGMHLHDLRGSATTMMAAMGIPRRIARRILGHANERITERVYEHYYDQEMQDAARLMAQFFAPSPPPIGGETGGSPPPPSAPAEQKSGF